MPAELGQLDFISANRWFKDQLRKLKIRRPVVGSADISWEGDRFQIHWHLGTMTSNPDALNAKLDSVFPADEFRIKPVMVKTAYDHGFIPYSHKVIDIADILRQARRTVPDLFLTLHNTEPLSTMILMNVRLSTLDGRLVLRPIQR